VKVNPFSVSILFPCSPYSATALVGMSLSSWKSAFIEAFIVGIYNGVAVENLKITSER
jgi:hypothetical protein